MHGPDILGFTAALAAYRDGQPWLDELLAYLEGNREFLLDYGAAHLPGIHMARPEGTYLAWLDCRDASLPDTPYKFFLDHARVAVNDGATFGRGGDGFVQALAIGLVIEAQGAGGDILQVPDGRGDQVQRAHGIMAWPRC